MIHTEFEQGTQAWLDYKVGKVSASRIIDIMPGARGPYRASRKNYMAELACEILTGQKAEWFTTDAMQRGTELEAVARAEYEMIKNVMVTECGFIDHPTIENAGSSPDGMVQPDGGIEIKCPNTATHIETLAGGNIKTDYIYQMQFNMNCSGAKWWDFVSFDDRLPLELQIYIERVNNDEKLAVQIDAEVTKFQLELTAMLNKFKDLKGDK